MRYSIYLLCLFMFAHVPNGACKEYFHHPDKTSRRVSQSFEFTEEQVKDYHDNPSEHDEEIMGIIDTGFFANSKEILDIGCGDGKRTALFAAHLQDASLTGCDISKAMIEFASQHYASSNVHFVEKNAENLDFSKKFDAVISFNCLHWIKNQKKVFEQVFNVLNSGGKALLVATPHSSNNDFKTICRSIIVSFRWLPHFVSFRSGHSFHTPKEYKKLLKNVGFSIDKMEIKKKELVFNSRKELDPFLSAVLTPLQHLDPKDRPAFLDDFFQELGDRGKIDAQGVIHISYDQIEMIVTKHE